MGEISLVNFAVVFALVPICQGLVQMLKSDKMSPYFTRVLSLAMGLLLAFLVRQANVAGFSVSLGNIYVTTLTGLVVALISSGFYDMQKAGIVKQIAESETDITVATEMVGADKDTPSAVKTSKKTS